MEVEHGQPSLSIVRTDPFTVFRVRGSWLRNHSASSPFIAFQPVARQNRYTSDALKPVSIMAFTTGTFSCLRTASSSEVVLQRKFH